jgi:DNA invertase Pin-like site-specific DNA recombinase
VDERSVVGYVRVSTSEQGVSGLGLAAQKAIIRRECEVRGWSLAEVIADKGESGKSLDRPGLHQALQLIASGEVTALIASKLDRISRSVGDFAMLLEYFTDAYAALVAVDVGVDTSSPGGKLVANVFASVAEWERDTIAARTRDALAELRAQGRAVGRPSVRDRADIAERIAALRDEGLTLQAIADRLNRDQVPTARGAATWRVSSVQAAAGYRRPPTRRARPELPKLRTR